MTAAPRVVRLADPGTNWDGVLALIRDAFAYMDGVIDPPSSAHRLDAAMLADMARRGIALGAIAQGRPVGCAFLDPRPYAAPPCLYLGKLAVAAEFRGTGIASRIVEAAAAEALRLRLPFLELQTRVELSANQAWFARRGFSKCGEGAHAGFARPTWIAMRRAIA
jgi:predicted N-acetyltransferase YhbS